MLSLSAAMAGAAESTPQQSPRVTATLISEVDSVVPGQQLRIGLRQRLAPHWHTYWQNPGDAGAPPTITLTLPQGVMAGEIDWPGPDRIPVGSAVSFGYEKEIVLPMKVTVPDDVIQGEKFSIQAAADWVVCEKECIPETGTFQLNLPVQSTSTPAGADVLQAFVLTDQRMPLPNPWLSSLTEGDGKLILHVEGEGLTSKSIKAAVFYPFEWGMVVHAAPQQLAIDPKGITLQMEKGLVFDAKKAAGLIAVTDGGGKTRWFNMEPSITGGELPVASGLVVSAKALPLWQMALFAFVGGLILNLMPCVFPVLAIKATSVIGMSGGALRELRLSGLFYTLGILAAFIALALALLFVRAGGNAVGWGFQFQSPLFVVAMSWLFLVIALNLSGVFEMGLSIAGAGQNFANRSGHGGSFFTGLLAVIVATPCTAPFMGVAIGSALTASALECLAIFVMMGLGLALPYMLLGIFPGLARKLPRPGTWMLRLRQAMAFPMYASAAWLLWVLVQQTGEFGLRVALAGALIIGLAAWLYGLAQHNGRIGWQRSVALAGILGLAGLLVPLQGVQTSSVTTGLASSPQAERFSAERLTTLRQEGKPVFINMTAAWCITCLVNEQTTLSTQEVQQTLRDYGVTYLKGDWTNQDPEITAFLHSFQRDGLPFYAFYPAGSTEPVLLPPVLTQAIVIDAIQTSTTSAKPVVSVLLP
ncbi:MAG: protein-disulfide reductase DsbD family protein [Azovibrio sp.]